MPKLKLVSERYRGKIFDLLHDRESCGRSKDCTLCIPDTTMSSHHCDIVKVNGRYILKDAGSTNGSRINNIPVTEQELFHSDIIQLGGVEMLFDDENDESRFITRTQHGIQIENSATRTVTIAGLTRPQSHAPKSNALLIAIFIVLVLIIVVLLVLLYKAMTVA